MGFPKKRCTFGDINSHFNPFKSHLACYRSRDVVFHEHETIPDINRSRKTTQYSTGVADVTPISISSGGATDGGAVLETNLGMLQMILLLMMVLIRGSNTLKLLQILQLGGVQEIVSDLPGILVLNLFC